METLRGRPARQIVAHFKIPAWKLPRVGRHMRQLMARDAGRISRPIAVAVEVFGPTRLMYGSDWPLARLGVGAPAWLAAVEVELRGLDDESRLRVFGGTATEHYRLAAP